MQAAIGGANLALLPRAGHLSNLETPDEFAKALSGFLATL
jgi:pimeloyl-ACP methyl ester carboxylesterase